MMLEYKLIIKGSAEGIQITCWGPHGMTAPFFKEEDIEYITRAPGYRYRTADELWAEIIYPLLGSGKSSTVAIDATWITINGLSVLRNNLGTAVGKLGICPHSEWEKIFLKEEII